MPFEKVGKMSPKKEFVILASQPGANISQLCKRYGVSRATGYKWIERFKSEGEDGLEERSRRPESSPLKVDEATEELLVLIRDERPTWGARKIKRYLENHGEMGLPSPSTITEILRRNGRLEARGVVQRDWKRFERDAPMELLHMDFKGHFEMGSGRCHPLTLMDDHSRYLLDLGACANEKGDTVKERLIEVFRRYGLPYSIITDNGAPWGAPVPGCITKFGVWLIRLGIILKHSGMYHPQTNGKLERQHRTLKAEVIQARQFRSINECQRAFDEWRDDYNCVRPHEGIGMLTPADKFCVSNLAYPDRLPEIEFGPDDEIRKVQQGGVIHLHGKRYWVGQALRGYNVAVRTVGDGLFDVYFIRQHLLHINLRDAPMGASKNNNNTSFTGT